MASVYNPGLLGVKSPQNCGCQELLSISDPTQFGWLRRKCLRNKLHAKLKVFDWPQYYVIIHDKCLYYYKSETSKKPSGAVSLYGYNRVYRSNEVKNTEVPWSFKIEHIQPEMKSFYFSASSEQEMKKWMVAIKKELLEANNMGKRNINVESGSEGSESSWGSAEYNVLEGAIYNDDSNGKPRMSIISDSFDDGKSSDEDNGERNNYESPLVLAQFDGPESTGGSSSTVPVTDRERPDNLLDKAIKNNEDIEQKETSEYWAAIHFPGSRTEASEVINNIASNGVYLVRKSEDGLNVLQVYADIPRKYKIYVTEDGQNTLSLAHGPYFESLESMLFHYYGKALPHTDQCLTVPYKLHPEFINNERH